MKGDVFVDVGQPGGLGNQYTRPGGDPQLCQVLADEYSGRFGRQIDPLEEVVTTIGAQVCWNFHSCRLVQC